MVRPREFGDEQERMHARCLNWGQAMAGHVVNLDLRRAGGDGREADGPDADLIEDAIVNRMRLEKKQLYWLFRYLYLGGRSNVEAAGYFRKSESWVRKRHREGLDYLIKNVKTEQELLQFLP